MPKTRTRCVAFLLFCLAAGRRDIHQHPELGNREFRTLALVADHLRQLGLEVRSSAARCFSAGGARWLSRTSVVACVRH
jgi:metal-dependent amidase/aminoacylase/carboxypeptidase family protein